MKQKLQILLLLLLSIAAVAQEEYPVYFDVDKDVPNEQSLSRLISWMEDNRDVEVSRIAAFADSTAGTVYNMELSLRRAASLYQFLKTSDIRISKDAEAKGFGETKVFSENLSNDRVAIIYYTRMEVAAQPDKNRLVKGEPFDFEKTIYTAKKGDKIVIKGLHFYTDEARILPTSMAAINDLVAVMKTKPKLRIDIQGHMCCSEDRTNLAGDRAETIYKILVKSGINKRRMTFKGFGSEQPIYKLPEKNDIERDANKRVEIEIIEN